MHASITPMVNNFSCCAKHKASSCVCKCVLFRKPHKSWNIKSSVEQSERGFMRGICLPEINLLLCGSLGWSFGREHHPRSKIILIITTVSSSNCGIQVIALIVSRKWPVSLPTDCSRSDKIVLIQFARDYVESFIWTDDVASFSLHLFLDFTKLLAAEKRPGVQIRHVSSELWLTAKVICTIFTICHDVQKQARHSKSALSNCTDPGFQLRLCCRCCNCPISSLLLDELLKKAVEVFYFLFFCAHLFWIRF